MFSVSYILLLFTNIQFDAWLKGILYAAKNIHAYFRWQTNLSE